MYILNNNKIEQKSLKEVLSIVREQKEAITVVTPGETTPTGELVPKSVFVAGAISLFTFLLEDKSFVSILENHTVLQLTKNNQIKIHSIDWLDNILDGTGKGAMKWTSNSVCGIPGQDSFCVPGDNHNLHFHLLHIIYNTIDYYVINNQSKKSALEEKNLDIEIESYVLKEKDQKHFILPYRRPKMVVRIPEFVPDLFASCNNTKNYFPRLGKFNILDVFTRCSTNSYLPERTPSFTNWPENGCYVIVGNE